MPAWSSSGTSRRFTQPPLGGSYDLLAPDLLIAEFTNAAWQKVRRGDSTLPDAQAALNSFVAAPIQFYTSLPLAAWAFQIAAATNRTAYDSFYLALALADQCSLVTADRRFYNALLATPYAAHLIWVEDL